MEITLTQAQIRFGDLPNGGKLLQFVTPQGIVVNVPLDSGGAQAIVAGLGSGIIVASGPITPLPTNGRPN